MRLNDALNCGAPLVVSRGMGGVKMVDDYGCGLAFQSGDADDLAKQLEELATSSEKYVQIVKGVCLAVERCSASAQANELCKYLLL